MTTNKAKSNEIKIKGKVCEPVQIGSTAKGRYANIKVYTEVGHSKQWTRITSFNEGIISTMEKLNINDFVNVEGKVVEQKQSNGKKDLRIIPFRLETANSIFENRVSLRGRLVSEIEIKPAGQHQYGRIAIAVPNKQSIDNEGQPDFINITLWNKLAEKCSEIKKGEMITLKGFFKNTSYVDKTTNEKVYKNEIAPISLEKVVFSNTSQNSQNTEDEYEDLGTPLNGFEDNITPAFNGFESF